MTITYKEMQELLGESISGSLYRMCLQKFSTVSEKRDKGSYLVRKAFNVANIIEYMNRTKPHGGKIALWQEHKEFIQNKLLGLMRGEL